jgi:3',5'-cyclic AMP phosphodiesterase CpdA
VRPFRFAIISDPHVTLPHTLWDSPNRFHLLEVSLGALEAVLTELSQADLDFLLLPGDLTQHGEWDNHHWLVQQLQALPFPTYVVPGNHDIITRSGGDRTLGLADFPQVYQAFGYGTWGQPYYRQTLVPGVTLIGLNSIGFDDGGEQLPYGWIDGEQLTWLAATLADCPGDFVIVMVHHNLLDHLPGQHQHPLGQRYSIRNRQALLDCLQGARVPLVLTGHLHVQDVAQAGNLWEITTGSLVSYPHPYRYVTATPIAAGQYRLTVTSQRVRSLPDWPDLQGTSLQWMRDRAVPFMTRLLTLAPFHLSPEEAAQHAPALKTFWATIAAGDGRFDYPHLPPDLQAHLRRFGTGEGTSTVGDNALTLTL